MLKISTTQCLGYVFSVIYDSRLMFSGFFDLSSLPKEMLTLSIAQDANTLAKEVCAWYADDHATQLPLPKQLMGTAFQQSVWKAIADIPKGETCSYSRLAVAIRRPSAVRAVGTSCGQNPLSLITPCHRVVGVASLGGYRWGANIKKSLLEYESTH
jgi:O-6-methylguanine DNA methyltransferase